MSFGGVWRLQESRPFSALCPLRILQAWVGAAPVLALCLLCVLRFFRLLRLPKPRPPAQFLCHSSSKTSRGWVILGCYQFASGGRGAGDNLGKAQRPSCLCHTPFPPANTATRLPVQIDGPCVLPVLCCCSGNSGVSWSRFTARSAWNISQSFWQLLAGKVHLLPLPSGRS